MYCVKLLVLLFLVAPSIQQQDCEVDQSPLDLIEEYISESSTDITSTYFLKSIIKQFGEFTRVDSLRYRKGISDEEIQCLSKFIKLARSQVIFNINSATSCLSDDTQAQYECLDNKLFVTNSVINAILREVEQQC